MPRRLLSVSLIVVVGLMSMAGAVLAQGGLDASLPPTFGSTALVSGFTPDPFELAVSDAGGAVDVNAEIGDVCAGAANGFVNSAPDYVLDYTAGDFSLRFFFVGAGDPVMVVAAPDGNFYCDDDQGGRLMPQVTFTTPETGTYSVWVGTYDAGATVSGIIYTTEIDQGPMEFMVGGEPVGSDDGKEEEPTYDETLLPAFGETELVSGFQDDPFIAESTIGGPLEASAVFTCAEGFANGYMGVKPALRVDYTNGQFPLRFFYYALAGEDTTMVVRDPAGNFYCDDDTGGLLQPMVTFDSPASGEYLVWVGTFMADTYAPGGVFVTETQITPVEVDAMLINPAEGDAGSDAGADAGTGGSFDMTLAPTFGETTLASGFSPDPATVELMAGGSVDVFATLGETCEGTARGYAATAPDYRLQYTAGQYQLRVFFAPTDFADTTMVINAPDGSWYCSDDAEGTLSPMIVFNPPVSGQYDIWVGTYSSGEFVPGTLYITETEASPATVQ